MIEERAVFDGRTLWIKFHDGEISESYSENVYPIKRDDGVYMFDESPWFPGSPWSPGMPIVIGKEDDFITMNYRNI